MQLIIQFVLLALGFTMLVKGADWFVDGSSAVARRFGIPQLVIGLTIVAMGTSAPEAAVSITAALHGSAEITIGNIVGSNILNILIILGLSSLLCSLAVAKSTIRVENPFMILITLALLALGLDGTISLFDGIILLAFFGVYLGYLFWMAKKGQETVEEAKEQPLWKSLLMTVIGLAFIVWGSDVTVDAATALARIFGMSERFIGLTIVALGTSLPELFTSVNAARKGNADIAIGNIVGSNIFNILFVVGLSGLIVPVPFDGMFIIDTLVAIAAAAMLGGFCVLKGKLVRWHGIVMLASYAVYLGWLLMK